MTVAEVTISELIKLRLQFLELTAYSSDDILAFNLSGMFLTRNGGKYQLIGNGKIRHIAGPDPDPSRRL